jgi:hypothetical protein
MIECGVLGESNCAHSQMRIIVLRLKMNGEKLGWGKEGMEKKVVVMFISLPLGKVLALSTNP